MRIVMLGWEFPPFIAGGLGVACYGLTRALDRMGHDILFILPRPVDRSQASHITLLSPDETGRLVVSRPKGARGFGPSITTGEFRHVVFRGVEASFSSPYPGFAPPPPLSYTASDPIARLAAGEAVAEMATPEATSIATSGAHYSGDLVGDAERYARLVVALARRERFDAIHAHDWLTYPAGIALSRASGRPLVVHVHSTEFDRSGERVNQRLYDIERRGMHAAARVIAVSEYTKSICVKRYGVPEEKVDVVYNGIDREADQPAPGAQIESRDRIVLFLGRITMQKGPEYFIGAAKRVLEKVENVKFVVAGSGDMTARMIELAAQMGIGHKVLFTGFLRGRDVERVFRMADCYVMPSVSEPFGIAALEAIHHDVPVIISKQSGVSEVLTHVLKVDFWDVDEMANKIVAVLRHPPLSQTLRHHGPIQLRWLTWDGAAEKCVKAYAKAIHG
ncbi:MAG: glycosyltransferase [Phycisphaerae bacterium]|nr:glycosyltransferase [Phycisphaerae bacterium]